MNLVVFGFGFFRRHQEQPGCDNSSYCGSGIRRSQVDPVVLWVVACMGRFEIH